MKKRNLILVGALITVYSQVKHPWIPLALGLFILKANQNGEIRP